MALLVLAGAIILTGCIYREHVVYRQPGPEPVVATEIVVNGAPPAPRAEVITVAPGPNFVWISGGWAWQNRWVWQRGHWECPPRIGAVWVPHHYIYRGGRHIFIRGGWRKIN